MSAREFVAADMTCIVEGIHDAGEVIALEWLDPRGRRGCGFLTMRDELIARSVLGPTVVHHKQWKGTVVIVTPFRSPGFRPVSATNIAHLTAAAPRGKVVPVRPARRAPK
jgi:hypothetical protein